MESNDNNGLRIEYIINEFSNLNLIFGIGLAFNHL